MRNRRPNSRRPVQARDGLTLVECMFAAVLASTLVVMALNTFGSISRGRQAATSLQRAAMLANHLLSEIVQNSYSDPAGGTGLGPDAGETTTNRGAFDDVDDYNNWNESPPQYKDGTTIPNYTGWRRQVTVQYVDPTNLAGSTTDQGFKLITVTVTDPQGRQTVRSAIRGSSGAYNQRPTQQTTCVRWVGLELQVGPDAGAGLTSGTGVPNFVP